MTDINTAKANIGATGFLDVEIDVAVDLFAEIERLKKEKNAVVLAHYYQEPDIQDVADFIGDSLGLAQQAEKTLADIIVFAGVHFMAETAKILNPGKKVLLPDLRAGCSLSDSAPPELFKIFKDKHPDHLVITYINCSAGIKALSDIICTSSNAETIIQSLPKEQKIIFAPDRNLGAYLNKKTRRNMVLWNGACMVHEIFSLEKITRLKMRHPQAKVIAHPECEDPVLTVADYIGSTTGLLKFSQNSTRTKSSTVFAATGWLTSGGATRANCGCGAGACWKASQATAETVASEAAAARAKRGSAGTQPRRRGANTVGSPCNCDKIRCSNPGRCPFSARKVSPIR